MTAENYDDTKNPKIVNRFFHILIVLIK